jgi:ABC-type bacteriocin/lantibiotic exporter with double-glycine peptidase domain
MPKVHHIGKQHFVQYIDFPVKWGWKLAVTGWTQEIDEPFRTATPIIVRLPFHKAVAFGKWTGQLEEEQALSAATGMRVLTDEDFEEGWTAPAYKVTEEDSWDIYT